ncbi:PhoX family protein [Paracoccus sanguinis]|uniref:PhoX family protein n=1 Tax=Paracoccus sanguinis TaxID=1545044 RepID=UPI00051FA6C9|nr:PhoX family phosphatase [Paracoccus sanguinis]KGJ21387.1 Tat pathway signal protein [Paracoccus sanguinis]
MRDDMNYEADYADPTQSPDFEPGDEGLSNTSANPTFYDVVETARASRRSVLFGGLAAAVTGVFGTGLSTRGALAQTTTAGGNPVAGATATAAPTPGLLGFKAVSVGMGDTVVVPEGYTVRTLGAWGTPILGDMPAFRPGANTGAEQAMQTGMHHDGMHFFPIDGSSDDGLLVVNHEYIEPRFLHAEAYKGQALDSDEVVYDGETRPDDHVLKEMNAHGVSVYRITKGADGAFAPVADAHNRRITALTEIDIAGPAKGSKLLVTKYAPNGDKTRGTINNCAYGVTPWNTYMAAEENWAGYFTSHDAENGEPKLPRELKRYGVVAGKNGRYGWEKAAGGADEYIRFDASTKGASAAEDYRNEPNQFGWMVEIDPFKPDAKPVKRTHLGRFGHEGVVFALAVEGKPVVCYSGDDSRFEYIYKFVSKAPFQKGVTDGSILDEGTLYVARFNPDGSGEWLALAPGENGLTPEAGFADLGEILVNTRAAADLAGATKMDRPEWGAVDPNTGEVYFTLTNNTKRTEAKVDPVNPRAKNQFGQIVRWRYRDADHAQTAFTWDLFVIAGDADTSRVFTGEALGEDNIFACPDGLWFDANSRLWIQTDIGEDNMYKGDMEQMGNNQMLCADPRSGEIRRFLTGPIGQEVTGVITTPDQKTMFVGLQHPGATTSPEDYAAGKFSSNYPDGNGAIPRSVTLVITRDDGGVIGA